MGERVSSPEEEAELAQQQAESEPRQKAEALARVQKLEMRLRSVEIDPES